MLAAVIALCLAQGSAPIAPPTEAPVLAAPPAPPASTEAAPGPVEAVAPSPDEPPEVGQLAQFVSRHLLSVDIGMGGLKVRAADRAWGLGESPAAAFHLVPEAMHLAESAEHDFAVARVLEVGSLAVTGVALAATLVTTLVARASMVLTVALISLAAMGLALVAAIIALPFELAAQEHFLQAIAIHNRGLLDLRPPRPLAGAGLAPAGPAVALP